MTRIRLQPPAQRAPAVELPGEYEIVWAVLALWREDPRRSFRWIGRTAGCSHHHAKKIVVAWREDADGIERELAAVGYLL